VNVNKAHQRVVIEATINRLAAEFPAAFFVFERRRRPLAIGIYDAVVAANPELDEREIKTGLAIYTGNLAYLRACIKPGAMRIGLDGREIEPVSAEHVARALERLAGAAAKRAKRAAAEQSTQTSVALRSLPCPETTNVPSPSSSGPPKLSLAGLRTAAQERRARQAAQADTDITTPPATVTT
jgi:sRNA-binding protein